MGNSYEELEDYFRKLYAFESSISLLSWDRATMMPKKSGKYRVPQLEELTKLCHDMITSKKLEEIINNAKSLSNLNEWQKANVREAERIFNEASSIPTKLAGEFSKTCSECELAWRDAKKNSNFKDVSPYLEKVVDIVHEIAELKAEKLGKSKYDVLLNQYETGLNTKYIDEVFTPLKTFLPEFIDTVIEKQKSYATKNIGIPTNKQKEISLRVMKDLGFDFDYGRLDESIHPFCGGIFGDIRITTNYDENNALQAIMGIVHETGHALYEQNLPEKYHDQPVGKALGMSIHESQSLFYEMQIGTSQEFLDYLSKIIQEIAGLSISSQELWQNINKVSKSFIRIYADEITYPLHIVIRYEIEKLLISREISVKDIPVIWNDLLNKYLGITPKNDKEGCLQDIHWYDGSFGYFPCYSLGALTAAQIFDTARVGIQTKDFVHGNFNKVKTWLKENIHKFGSLYNANEIIKKATGKELRTDVFINYLRRKYL